MKFKKKKERREGSTAQLGGDPWMGRRRDWDPRGLLPTGASTHSHSSIPHSNPITPFYRRGSRCSEKQGDLLQVIPSRYWQSWNSSSALDLKSFPGNPHSGFTGYANSSDNNNYINSNKWFPRWLSGKPGNGGDMGLVPGSGRSPGERNGNLLHYSSLGNPMMRVAWWATVHRAQRAGRNWAPCNSNDATDGDFEPGFVKVCSMHDFLDFTYVSTTNIPISQSRQLKLRGVKNSAWGHRAASDWWSQDWAQGCNPARLGSKPQHCCFQSEGSGAQKKSKTVEAEGTEGWGEKVGTVVSTSKSWNSGISTPFVCSPHILSAWPGSRAPGWCSGQARGLVG